MGDVLLFQNAGNGFIADTETSVELIGESHVWMRVRCLPGLAYWSCPDAAKRRRWVDTVLAGTGLKREGRFEQSTIGSTYWNFKYYVGKAA